MGNSEEDAKELEGANDVEDIEMDVEEDEGANLFKIEVREVGRGFAFPETPITNSDTVEY